MAKRPKSGEGSGADSGGDGLTLVKGKGGPDQDPTEAQLTQTLERITECWDVLKRAQLRQRQVNGSATEAINAAKTAFSAVVEEPFQSGHTSKNRVEKLERVEEAWQSLCEVEAKAKADRHEAKCAVDVAEEALDKEIQDSRQGSLDFGNEPEEPTEGTLPN